MLYICGRFYYEYKPVIEPLSKLVSMISDLTCTCYVEVAILLWALIKGWPVWNSKCTIRLCLDLCYLYCINCRLDYTKSDFHLIFLYLVKLAWQLLWQMTAPIRYEFWSYNRNSMYMDQHSFIYVLLCLMIKPQTQQYQFTLFIINLYSLLSVLILIIIVIIIELLNHS